MVGPASNRSLAAPVGSRDLQILAFNSVAAAVLRAGQPPWLAREKPLVVEAVLSRSASARHDTDAL